MRFDVQGKNDIFDPRMNNGAGGRQWTNNAALVIADFMVNPYWGMGYSMNDINQTQLIAAANICDIAIDQAEGGQIAQYTINGTFTTATTPSEILQSMLTAMGGTITNVDGQWYIYPGAYVFPTSTIDSSMMLSSIQVKTGQKGRDLINAVKGHFVCPAAVDTIGSPNVFLNEQPNIFNGQWQTQAFPAYAMDQQHGYSSDIWLTKDGQKLYADLSLPFTTNSNTAQRLAKQVLLKNRSGNGLDDAYNQGASFTVTCNLQAYNIVPHDTVWVSYPRFNWTAPPAGYTQAQYNPATDVYTEFEVMHVDFAVHEQSGAAPMPAVTLTLRATSPNIYVFNPSDQVPLQGNKYPQFENTMQVPAPTNFEIQSGANTVITGSDGSIKSSILCTWTPPADGFVSHGGKIILQLMPYTAAQLTYNAQANQDNITINGTTNPFTVGEYIILYGANSNGGHLTSQIYAVDGQVCYVTIAPYVAVSGGFIQTAGWETIANLYGGTSKFSITNVSDGDLYFVQIFAENTDNRTSSYLIAGPLQVSNGITNTANGIPVYPPNNPNNTIIQGALGVNKNLIPDSDMKFHGVYWTVPGPNWSFGAGTGYNGLNCIQCGIGASSYTINSDYAVVTPGAAYNFSGYINAIAASGGNPTWSLVDVNTGQEIVSFGASPGQAGRYNATFTVPSTTNYVYAKASINTATIPAGSYVQWSAPMLQAGNTMTAYLPNFIDDASGKLAGPITIGQINAAELTLAQMHDNVSLQLESITLQNANFAGGNVGWLAESGWTINQAVPNPLGNSSYIGFYSGITSTTQALFNNQNIPCPAGGVVAANYYAKASDAGCTGQLQLWVIFYGSTGNQIQSVSSPSATVSDWTPYRVVATAPTGTSYAKIAAVIQNTSSTDWWGVCGFTCTLLANSIDEVPDGSIAKKVNAATGIVRAKIGAQGAVAGYGGSYCNFTGTTINQNYGVATGGDPSKYNVIVIDRIAMTVDSFNGYDPETTPSDAGAMATMLNSLPNLEKIVIVYTNYNPLPNSLTGGLPAAMFRCGASNAFTSALPNDGAYILVGIPGVNQGNGIELLNASAVETSVTIIDGQVQGMRGSNPSVSYVNQDGTFHVSGGFNQQGSIVVPFGAGDFTYSSNDASVTIDWVAFTIWLPSGASYDVPAGSYTQTGLAASTTYYFSPYWNIAGNVVNVLFTGTGVANPNQTQTIINGDGNIGLYLNIGCATTASSTTSSGSVTPPPSGGGGSGYPVCPAIDQMVETLEHGYIRADELQVGMHVHGWGDNHWNRVNNVSIEDAYLASVTIHGETLKVDIHHLWLAYCEHGPDCNDCWIETSELRLSDALIGHDGNAYYPESITNLGPGRYVKLNVDTHRFRLGKVIGHNAISYS